jgi:hypothetical protein
MKVQSEVVINTERNKHLSSQHGCNVIFRFVLLDVRNIWRKQIQEIDLSKDHIVNLLRYVRDQHFIFKELLARRLKIPAFGPSAGRIKLLNVWQQLSTNWSPTAASSTQQIRLPGIQ